MVLRFFKIVWPVMLTYVAIGAPCGMIMGQTGMEPWMVFALSSTFVTGSGQFMICNLWLAGVPAPSIIASVAAISSRFALYSAAIAPHLAGASKRQTLAVAATLTEEAYGISLAKLVEGEDWGPRESFVLNVILIATWGASCTMGAIVGAVADVPTAIASFVCTSLFICLLFSQRLSRGNVVAAVSGAVSVAVCKFLGLANIAVPASVVVGMATCGIAAGARPVLAAFTDEVARRGVSNVTIAQTGCIGICQYEPVVEVFEPGREKVTYVKMTPEKAARVVAEHLINGKPVAEYTIGAMNQ